jgi:hypothetical protein
VLLLLLRVVVVVVLLLLRCCYGGGCDGSGGGDAVTAAAAAAAAAAIYRIPHRSHCKVSFKIVEYSGKVSLISFCFGYELLLVSPHLHQTCPIHNCTYAQHNRHSAQNHYYF